MFCLLPCTIITSVQCEVDSLEVTLRSLYNLSTLTLNVSRLRQCIVPCPKDFSCFSTRMIAQMKSLFHRIFPFPMAIMTVFCGRLHPVMAFFYLLKQ